MNYIVWENRLKCDIVKIYNCIEIVWWYVMIVFIYIEFYNKFKE